MRIELNEDNGIINNGVPTLVILTVDGKHRIPYEADKTIQQLYADAKKICDVGKEANLVIGMSNEPTKCDATIEVKEGEIEREDIVKCVKVYPRDEGEDCDLVFGNEYRVINIAKTNGVTSFYEVLDDNSGSKIRIPCFPDELSLLTKHNPKKKKVQVYETIVKCPCGEDNSLRMVDGVYVGNCVKCGEELRKSL